MNLSATANEAVLQHQECVLEAAVDILRATCNVQLQPQAESECSGSETVIIAIISLMGDVEWSLFLGLPRPTATALAERFAGFAIPFESPDMGDAMGELANILAGDVKARLDRKGVRANISLPSVIRAEGIEVLVQRNALRAKMCFACQVGKLWTGVIAQSGGAGVVA